MISSNLQTRILRKKSTLEEYQVYRAGLEWDLTDPIVIEKREDFKSEHRWRDLLEPFHHQVTNLITFCRRLPVTLLADDVGLGKTISAGLIISELIARSRLSKVLIVCPKLLCPQWQEELQTKFNIPSEIAIGKKLVKTALINANSKENIAVITTYHSARLYLDSIPPDRFQMLVLDEAHKLRNLYGVENPPLVAKCFLKALEERRFQFVLMLTATPIQNRLWDLYSLVDLLTVARGHKNPFGSEGMFARKFIADSRDKARQLKRDARDEFRSIVYGYMSRIRRGDAKLYFPDRVVHMHKVNPTTAELKLIDAITEPIQSLNRLAQISILQALTSSPHALMSQLNNMAMKGTVPNELAATVRTIVNGMPVSAKLHGLGELINKLKEENPSRWRLVVFTGRLETQTTIQAFLEEYGLKVGIINGMSGPRNQDTLARFRRNPPDCHVIVSTEAGSEGINLQVANVLVNFDLPWNPMIVEQRIGRVQRLASEHASVGVFNIMLQGTFEEYIVGRLMEKLQMASHAIGDIEALLEASGISGEDENGAISFDEKIRQLVIAALAGKDVETATRKAEQSITNAKLELEREEQAINDMLGRMDGAEYVGPRAPKLPEVERSMAPREFTLAAFRSFGAEITLKAPDLYLVKEGGGREYICFEEKDSSAVGCKLYSPGSAAFARLVERVIATGIYDVEDVDQNISRKCEEISSRWVDIFEGIFKGIEIEDVYRLFEGTALVRVRATVAHDSYERLVELSCVPTDHYIQAGKLGLEPLASTVEDPSTFGIKKDKLSNAAKLDTAISEFSRFYLERRAQEMKSAGDDERKRRKLEDDFTPRYEMALVSIEGRLHRRIELKVHYRLDAEMDYYSILTVTPHKEKLDYTPEFGVCDQSGRTVPKTCLEQCQISKVMALKHLLLRSEISSRFALPEFTVRCSLSGKRVLKDEAELSSVSGRLVARELLKKSALSGKRAEPEHFSKCEFTNADVLNAELATSEVSGKKYRMDEQLRSIVSGKTGHKSEFLFCHETGHPLIAEEAQQCEVTGYFVKPGILEECATTQKKVLPSELERCAATGKKVLKKFLVTSSLSGVYILEEVATRSATGKFCTPPETKLCQWSGRKFHPDDLRICDLTGLNIHFEFATSDNIPRLQPLFDLLAGIKRTSDAFQLWDIVTTKLIKSIKSGRCKVESSVLSPDGKHLAVCSEVRTLLGFRVRQIGFVFSIEDNSIVGRLSEGKRTSEGWSFNS